MDKIKFKCNKCGKIYSVASANAGKMAKCVCGHRFPVPDSSEDFFKMEHDLTPAKEERYQRINARLQNERDMPTFDGPMWTTDDSETQLRTPKEVAQRIFPLWAASIKGEGEPWDQYINPDLVWPYATPIETDFLRDPKPDPHQAMSMVWRLESIWVLMWAIQKVPDLPWPSKMCDTKKLMPLCITALGDDNFVSSARLRPKAEILDEQELIMRIHWATTDARINGRQIPENLDWQYPGQMVEPTNCAAHGVIIERHHSLNWLIRFGNDDWDDVASPT